jgi:hypothetical protein
MSAQGGGGVCMLVPARCTMPHCSPWACAHPHHLTAAAPPPLCAAPHPQLEVGQVQPPVEQEAGYTGVAAPKRRRVEEAPAAVLDEAPPKVPLCVAGCPVMRAWVWA